MDKSGAIDYEEFIQARFPAGVGLFLHSFRAYFVVFWPKLGLFKQFIGFLSNIFILWNGVFSTQKRDHGTALVPAQAMDMEDTNIARWDC